MCNPYWTAQFRSDISDALLPYSIDEESWDFISWRANKFCLMWKFICIRHCARSWDPPIRDWIFKISQSPKPTPWRSYTPPPMNNRFWIKDRVSVGANHASIAFVLKSRGRAWRRTELHQRSVFVVEMIIAVLREGSEEYYQLPIIGKLPVEL